MIAFVQGKLQYRDGENIVINVGGIGYHVVIPAKLVAALPPLGENIAVHTYFHLREDEASLFGFLQQDDLHLFKLLLSVSGIGPRVALNIVGATDHNSLMQAILAEDLAYLMKMPGIGKKTAQRLILELKDKVANYYRQEGDGRPEAAFAGPDPIFRDAFNGLLSLGYSSEEVTPLLVKGKEMLGEGSSVEDLIRFVLRESARARRQDIG